MKAIKLLSIAFTAATLLILTSCSSSQTATKGAAADAVRAAIDSNSWTFVMQNMQPQIGGNQMSNGFYTVNYATDTLNSYLPYFGRAFSGVDVYNSNKSVLDFISTDFSIDKEQKSVNRWNIIIKPKDQKEIQQMNFTLFASGSATLNVVLTNRSPISFTGTVRPLKKGKQ